LNDVNSKHAKYFTKNPISRFLVSRFFQTIRTIIHDLKPESLLDCGCGEGIILHHYSHDLQNTKCYAIDMDPTEVRDAQKNNPHCIIHMADIETIPFEDNSFDLLVSTEVFEHLENPDQALNEVFRVSKKYILLSVPREPIWRIMNILRFSYISNFGNTPGHLNHWSKKSFINYVTKNRSVELIKVKNPLPWTVLCLKKV
jgi:ubiquinone/menaquinone biosynthesis C-methylase UbiE